MVQKDFNKGSQSISSKILRNLIISSVVFLIAGLVIGLWFYFGDLKQTQKKPSGQVNRDFEKTTNNLITFLNIKDQSQCPREGLFLTQQFTRCQLNEKYNLLVEWLGSSKDNRPTGYIVSLEDRSTKKRYYLFNKKGLLDPAGGVEVFKVKLLNDNWAELSWHTGDMGWFGNFFKIIDFAKKEVVPFEVVAASDGLTVVKNNAEYKIKLLFDASAYSYEKGGEILAKDIELNGKPQKVLASPISHVFEPYSCMLGCPELYFPQFVFLSEYKKDLSAIKFSLKRVGDFIFYVDEGRVERL